MTDVVQRTLTLMRDAGLNQTDLARLAGIPRMRLNDFLTGKTVDPKLSTIVGIARALDVTVDYLVGHAARDSVATTPDEAALLADYRALDAASKAFVRRTAASEAAEARAKMPAPRSASSEVA